MDLKRAGSACIGEAQQSVALHPGLRLDAHLGRLLLERGPVILELLLVKKLFDDESFLGIVGLGIARFRRRRRLRDQSYGQSKQQERQNAERSRHE